MISIPRTNADERITIYQFLRTMTKTELYLVRIEMEGKIYFVPMSAPVYKPCLN
jgi:hypothetical protein